MNMNMETEKVEQALTEQVEQEQVEQELVETEVGEIQEDISSEPAVKVIEVQNPSAEESKAIGEGIVAGYNFAVDVKSVIFNFKKSKDKETGIVTERKPVHLVLPYPSVKGLVDIVEAGGKGLELLQEAMEGVVNNTARDILADGVEGLALTAATFPVDNLAWEVIANIPKIQRRGGGIPKETWEDFASDYLSIMPEATGKTLEAVGNMVKILKDKLSRVRGSDEILNLVIEQLAIYADKSPNIEDYQDCVAFLANKAENFLDVTPAEMLEGL